jgi:serine/threonine protein phosphatase PrpC
MQTALRFNAFKFETASVTHAGCVRHENEDAVLARPDLGIWAVADGAGGHEGGQFASQAVIKALNAVTVADNQLDLIARVEERLTQANAQIIRQSDAMGGTAMGSTVAALLIVRTRIAWVWAGDSRIYRLRDGYLTQLTRDHSEVQELLDHGVITAQEAFTWHRRNVITRAIGAFDDLCLEVEADDLRINDTYLLCSDGLTGHIHDAELAEHMATGRAHEVCNILLKRVLERGGRDNISIIVVRCHRAESTHFIPANTMSGARG